MQRYFFLPSKLADMFLQILKRISIYFYHSYFGSIARSGLKT